MRRKIWNEGAQTLKIAQPFFLIETRNAKTRVRNVGTRDATALWERAPISGSVARPPAGLSLQHPPQF